MGRGLDENWTSFQALLHHQNQKNMSPTPIWIQEKNGRHLVKIEDTHQEEEFQVRESFQALMATPISDEIAQKIFKAMEEQTNALKKIGSLLTKLEEAKLKK